MGVEGKKLQSIDYIESLFPLGSSYKVTSLCHLEEHSTGFAVDGSDFLVVQGI